MLPKKWLQLLISVSLNANGSWQRGSNYICLQRKCICQNPAWVYHDKVGYLFPSGGDVTVSSPKQTGAWKDINISGSGKKISADIFNLWISHGTKAKEGKYAYMVVPDRTLEEFRTFAAAQNYKIIQNSSVVQAVKVEPSIRRCFLSSGNN